MAPMQMYLTLLQDLAALPAAQAVVTVVLVSTNSL